MEKDKEIMVSVILITYNHEKYIKQCLDSILSQKVNFHYEVIVGNDCSTDSTGEILNSYFDKYKDILKVYNREKNLGPTNNLYDSIKKGKGKYMLLFEGDDYWIDSSKLQTTVDFLENNKDYASVFHSVDEIDENGNITNTYPDNTIRKNLENNEIENIDKMLKLLDKCYGRVSMHIHSILFKNFFIDEDVTEKHKETLTSTKMICDLQLRLLISSQGKMKFIPKTFTHYRYITVKNGTSFSSLKEDFKYNDTVKAWGCINKFFNYKYDNIVRSILLKTQVDNCIFSLIKFDTRNFINKFNRLALKGKLLLPKEVFLKTIKKVGVVNND